MSDFFNELIDPFAKTTQPEPKKEKHYIRQLPPGREVIKACITLTGFRNPTLLDTQLEGTVVELTIEQDELPNPFIEDPLHD